ncbi:predicted protein [Micromonas commoda]|uniref:Uncharacterized protein n=1 Tax=Micromonas commoda (strain RCC299 / NOUM17 / CCMP2709) TaxID=296587 RepID=C1E5T4_MICCC|nr:predicted protein [Micromonas commoda]ACO63309.1 predicted protein [Micromonas commoda]|eukprot:XP_002502051.1 predicted protein [Micromonas commoda]
MTDSPRARRPRAPKPLKWIVADLLARHVDELVDAGGESLRHLPCDVRDALLAVARRRRCLDDAALRALVDESTTIIDASGCGGGRVTDAGIAALAARRALRNVTAVDLSRCDGVTAAGLRILARAAPRLRTLRCGGDATCNAACEAAIPGIVPRLEDGGGVDDWETRAEVDSTTRATALEWLVWPDVRPDTRATIVRQCPRIRIVAPPREVHLRAASAVTDPSFAAVAGEGWIGFGRARTTPVTHRPVTHRGYESSPPGSSPRPVSQYAERCVGRGEDNDGLVVVAASKRPGEGLTTHRRGIPWWLAGENDVNTSPAVPPIEADPTRALDEAHLTRVDPRSWVHPSSSSSSSSPTAASIDRRGANKLLGENAATTASSMALRWRLKFAEDDVPIAERFRRACAEVEAARTARRERNHQKRKNRHFNRLAASSSERLIFRAMDDVSLVDLR